MLKLTSISGTEVYIDTDNHWFMRVPVKANPMADPYYPANERINYVMMNPDEPIVGDFVYLYSHFSEYYRTGMIAKIERD